MHKSSIDPSNNVSTFGRYLTVKTNGLSLSKMKTVDEENNEDSEKNSSRNNSVILLRPIGYRTKTNDGSLMR